MELNRHQQLFSLAYKELYDGCHNREHDDFLRGSVPSGVFFLKEMQTTQIVTKRQCGKTRFLLDIAESSLWTRNVFVITLNHTLKDMVVNNRLGMTYARHFLNQRVSTPSSFGSFCLGNRMEFENQAPIIFLLDEVEPTPCFYDNVARLVGYDNLSRTGIFGLRT